MYHKTFQYCIHIQFLFRLKILKIFNTSNIILISYKIFKACPDWIFIDGTVCQMSDKYRLRSFGKLSKPTSYYYLTSIYVPILNGKYMCGVIRLPLLSINLSGRKSSGSPQDSSISILLKFTISIVSCNKAHQTICFRTRSIRFLYIILPF